MGGCSCSGDTSGPDTGLFNGGDRSEIEELVKANSIEEANKLIKEGCVFLAAYWNTERASDEYVLGKVSKSQAPARKVGFSIP